MMTDIDEVARALSRAGQWGQALDLLDAAGGSALTAAECAVESDWFAGTELAAGRLTRCAGDGWDLRLLTLRDEYARQLGTPGDPGDLYRRCAELSAAAPDERRRGWAQMWLGLIADNLMGDRERAPGHYRAALRAADDDIYLEREALRHLGDHDLENGDVASAAARWERATALSARGGMIPGLLSQQLLLAVLARETGDTAGALLLAREIARAAAAIGAARLHERVAGFITETTAPGRSPRRA
ncbi:hypothetical protein [Actinoplanes sp. NPDC051851]|uniref:tetratricopeptide repeat protein n=1 Tax=Actinoplanes sp. NPDC051851 TaxID=3154753 RepID=UPI003433573B